jgi:APA family basic amino acid/polyamine antiporter
VKSKPRASESEDSAAPDRRLGLLHATALVVASMIGTGVFTTTGFAAADLGRAGPVLLVWVLGGLLALCGAVVYGELGAMMPKAGGEYVYLTEAFGPRVGFLSGWVSLTVGFSAPTAAAAIAFGRYLHAVVPDAPVVPAALLLIAAMTALHSVDVMLGSRVQTAFAVGKSLLILGFIVAAFVIGEGSAAHFQEMGTEEQGGVSAMAVSLVFVSYSYAGWNAAAYIGGEVKDPGKNLPRALIIGTAIVTTLYLGLNLAYFWAAPPSELAGKVEVGHTAAQALFGERAGSALSTLIALGLVSSVSAMTMAGPRVYAAMAEDGRFFGALARRNERGAPWAALLLQGLLAAGLAATSSFEVLLLYVGFTLSVFSALTVVAAFVLRRRAPDAPRPYRTWGWPLTPLLFLALSVWMVAYVVVERPAVGLAGALTLLVGAAVSLVWRGR